MPPWLNWVSSQWIQLDLLPIWAVFLARSNLTGHEMLLKLGRNLWIYTQCEQYSGLVELGIIPMNLLQFWAVYHARSNLTGQEMLLKMGRNSWIYTQCEQYSGLVELGIIPMNLLQFFFPFLVVPCEMTGPIAGETPPGVHLLNSQGTGHLDLQGGVVWYSLLKVAGDVQTLIFLRRRFNLMGVTVLTWRVIGLIIRRTSGGNECCGLMDRGLYPEGWPVAFGWPAGVLVPFLSSLLFRAT